MNKGLLTCWRVRRLASRLCPREFEWR